MVDVTAKDDTKRTAVAKGSIRMGPETIRRIRERSLPKGDPIEVARVAGILGAKQAPFLVPLCHPITLTGVTVDFSVGDDRVEITAAVTSVGKTGVEMEALTAVGAAALAIYDCCKAIDKGMVIGEIRLMEKRGGKSGDYLRSE